MASRVRTNGISINGETGWSAIHTEANMSSLLRQNASELWNCTVIPHTVHYHQKGVIVQPDNAYMPWKRRTYDVHAPGFEATRFRMEKTRDERS